jgi:ribonuclease HI
MLDHIIIYTDGSSRGNPGPGGYGAILIWGEKRKEIAQGYRKTTNNRMELMAVIAALSMLKKKNLKITIYSDSSYVVNTIEKKWILGWIKTNFKDKKNADLWRQYLALSKDQFIQFQWVKGHANNPFNNRCDELATAAADSKQWLVDEGFENDHN